MQPATRRQAFAAGALAFVLFLAWAALHRAAEGPFRTDEAHKISETHYLRLFWQGDFNSPEWFRNTIDRTNPPVGKYLFGAAILLAGKRLPDPPSLSVAATPGHSVPAHFPPAVNQRYATYLLACRRMALAATALAAAILVFCAARLHTLLAAAGAFAVFIANDLTLVAGATATFDPLLTLAATAIVLPAWSLWREPGGPHRHGAALTAGAISGLAIGIRLTGALCLLFSIVVLLVAYLRHRSRATIAAAAIVLVTAIALPLVLNPYYWAEPTPSSGVAAEFTRQESLPLRVAHRAAYQIRDLKVILHGLTESGEALPSLLDRGRFFGLILFSGNPGRLLWVSLNLALLVPLFRHRFGDEHRFLALWALIIAGGIGCWLPLQWERYLLPAVAPLSVAAGVGLSELFGALQARRHRARA